MSLPYVIRITDAQRELVAADWLARAEAVHRELRPQLAADYAAQMQGIFADGGEMIVAAQGESVLGVAVYRCLRDTSPANDFMWMTSSPLLPNARKAWASCCWIGCRPRRAAATPRYSCSIPARSARLPIAFISARAW